MIRQLYLAFEAKAYESYRQLFAKEKFYLFNKFLFNMAVRGMGIMNYGGPKVSGEYSFLKRHLSHLKDPVVLDVGANIGGYARLVKEVNPGAIIHAIEPHPSTFEELKAGAGASSYHAHNYACSSEPGLLELYDYEQGKGSSHASLHKDVIGQIHGHQNAASVQVQAVTLDEFVDQQGIKHIDLLKIDTEGHELNVLEGAQQSIRKGIIDAVHFEFNEMNVVSGAFMRDFEHALAGYDLYRMLPDELLSLKGKPPLMSEIFAYQNVVALKKK